MSYEFDQAPPPQGMSGGAKFAIGCGAAAFLLVVLACGGITFFGFQLVDKAKEAIDDVVKKMEQKVEDFAFGFEAQGYERVSGQVVDVTSDIERPTVYTVQVFKLNADSNASLAVMAQVAEINGTINGDLTFFGQSLVIHPDAVITGNLHVQMAQAVDNRGKVEGEIIQDEEFAIPFDPEAEEGEAPAAPADAEREAELKPSPGDVIETTPDDAPADETPDETSSDETPPVEVRDGSS